MLVILLMMLQDSGRVPSRPLFSSHLQAGGRAGAGRGRLGLSCLRCLGQKGLNRCCAASKPRHDVQRQGSWYASPQTLHLHATQNIVSTGLCS